MSKANADLLREKLDDQSQYSISLARAIEYHCRGEMVPDEIGRFCPHHAKLLNGIFTKEK